MIEKPKWYMVGTPREGYGFEFGEEGRRTFFAQKYTEYGEVKVNVGDEDPIRTKPVKRTRWKVGFHHNEPYNNAQKILAENKQAYYCFQGVEFNEEGLSEKEAVRMVDTVYQVMVICEALDNRNLDAPLPEDEHNNLPRVVMWG
jgi:hypothetical protein